MIHLGKLQRILFTIVEEKFRKINENITPNKVNNHNNNLFLKSYYKSACNVPTIKFNIFFNLF